MESSTISGGDSAPIVSTRTSSAPSAQTIIETMASALETTPEAIPPLYGTVDLEAIERVLQTNDHSRVAFEYRDFTVTADAAGSVEVCLRTTLA